MFLIAGLRTQRIRSILALLIALTTVSWRGCGDNNKKECEGENINDKLKEVVKPKAGTKVKIAPVKRKGEATPGDYTDVDAGIFDAILKRIGIDPCNTEPGDLKGKDGFIELENNSDVLNQGGKRATFGYFIRVNQGEQEVEYFALFSYDKIKIKKNDKDVIICATEFFLFGPFKRGEAGVEPDPPALVLGLAIDKNGCLLPEVPLDLAKVKNFVSTGHEDTEPVKPGVDKDGKGCLVCHGRDDQPPQSTLPFPWVKKP